MFMLLILQDIICVLNTALAVLGLSLPHECRFTEYSPPKPAGTRILF